MEEETRQVIFETNGKTYKELYDDIIEENLRNPPSKDMGTAIHHIVPRSICQILSQSNENMVRLTERDHLKAHFFLWQHYKRETDERGWECKMCTAFWYMVHNIEWRGDMELEWISGRFDELRTDFRKRMSEAMSDAMKRPEVRTKISEAVKRALNRPDVKAKLSKASKNAGRNPELRKKRSDTMKMAWKNPERRKSMLDAISGDNNPMNNQESRKKLSDTLKKVFGNAEVRRRRSDAVRGDKNPSKRPEVRAMISMAMKNAWKNPEVRAKISAKKSKKVLQYSLDGNFVAEYPSIKEAAVKTNSLKCCISSCCRGERKTHNGFIWKYAESK